MKKRIVAAAILVPVMFLLLYALPKIVMVFVVGIFCAIAAYELLYRTGLLRHVRLMCYSAVFAALVPLWAYFGANDLVARVGILVFFCLIFMEMMLAQTRLRFEKAALCVAAGLLVPYLLSSLTRIFSPDGGRYVILIPFVVAFLSDSGAYFIGCRFGKHKLAPVISPNKSVEGLFGGIAGATLGMVAYVFIMQIVFDCQVNYLYAVIYGLLGSLAATFGDLCLSVIKRQTGIKDYGNLIPGHGGILDRFDSMLTVGPLMEILLIMFPVVVK